MTTPIHPLMPCPKCDDEGALLVRHPELDDASPSGEAWLYEFCNCPVGQDAESRYEGDMLEITERE